MAELSEVSRKLIDTAMANDEPPAVDESWGTMVTRLTADAAAVPMPVTAAGERAQRSAGWIWIATLIAASALVVALWRPQATESKPSPSIAVPPASTMPANTPAGRTALPADRSVAEPPAKSAPEQLPPDQLLIDAEAALKASDPARALALLERHAVQAASDPSAPRRMALRVIALCDQGAREQARDEATALLAAHPQPQVRSMLRGSCVDELL